MNTQNVNIMNKFYGISIERYEVQIKVDQEKFSIIIAL